MTESGIGKKTVRDVEVSGKRILLRADLNVPIENGLITDDTRIREAVPTLQYLLDNGGRGGDSLFAPWSPHGPRRIALARAGGGADG